MGSHLSNLKDLADRTFLANLNFRSGYDLEPEELVEFEYYEIDEDGQFDEESLKKVFNWTQRQFLFKTSYDTAEIIKYEREFRRSLYDFPLFMSENWEIQLAYHTDRLKVYRPTPILWENLSVFDIKPNIRLVPFKRLVTETDDPSNQLSKTDLSKYLLELRREITFSLFISKMKFDGELMSFYDNPFSKFCKGFMVPFAPELMTETHDWLRNFDWLGKIDIDLRKWTAELSQNSNYQWRKFLDYQKSSLIRFRDGLRLDDEKFWREKEMMSDYCDNLKAYSSLLILLTGYLQNSNNILWDKVRKLEKDLAYLLEELLKSYVNPKLIRQKNIH